MVLGLLASVSSRRLRAVSLRSRRPVSDSVVRTVRLRAPENDGMRWSSLAGRWLGF